MTLHCWIVYNGNLGEKFLQHAEIFRESAEKQAIKAEIMPNNHLFSIICNGRMDVLRKPELALPDFVLFWDKDVYLARQLENMGVPVFNSAHTIEICDDKCKMYQQLGLHGIRMPKTILAPKVFAWSGVRDLSRYNHVVGEIGFPMVIKEAFGSFGSQVYLISDMKEMTAKVKELGSIPFLFQEFISSSYGTDLRIQVVGDEVVAAMRRVSEHDFRANVGKGAAPYAHQPTVEQAELAVRCAKAVGASFAGVDLLFGPDGEPIACEVNSNAHIINLRKATGINAADAMLAYMKNKTLVGHNE